MKKRIAFTMLIMVVYLLGKHIPLSDVLITSSKKTAFTMSAVINYMVSDDPVTPSLFILGLSPWMSAMILSKIIMVLRHPNAKRDQHNRGRLLTISLTIVFSIIQAFVAIQSISLHYVSSFHIQTELLVMLEMITGAFFVVWLAEKNSLYGIGGPSVIILMNILMNMVGIIKNGLLDVKIWSPTMILSLVVAIVYILMTMVISVIFTVSERRIPVYKTMIDSQFSNTSYLAIKVSPMGTLVLMYIMALFSLIRTFVSFLGFFFQQSKGMMWVVHNWRLETLFGLIVFSMIFILFSLLITLLLMNPRDMSENFLKAGDCLEGIRPGQTTTRYLRHLLIGYTLISSFVILIMIITPLIISMRVQGDTQLYSLPFTILVLGSIILNIKDEIEVRRIAHRYEKIAMM